MSAILRKMRKALDEYMDSGVGPSPSTRTLFANNPTESDELLRELFVAYDAGDKPDLDIEALLRIRLVACTVHTEKSIAAHARKSYHDAAYQHPPTARRAMWLLLRNVVHHGEAPAHCEALVRSYPAVAAELLATLLLIKTHDRFYARNRGESIYTQREIDALRAMLARAEGSRLLEEIGGADGVA